MLGAGKYKDVLYGLAPNVNTLVLFYNNTILSETAAQGASNVHWRNNLFLGENSAPPLFAINTFTNYTSSDYNGFRPNPGAPYSFAWNSPPTTVAADYSGLEAPGQGGGHAQHGERPGARTGQPPQFVEVEQRADQQAAEEERADRGLVAGEQPAQGHPRSST